MSIKTKRIASEMTRVISQILLEEARDSLLKKITITGAEVAPDLSFAKVYFTSLISNMSQLAEKMDLRNTPKLKFVYDESIEYANNIERIIKEIHESDE